MQERARAYAGRRRHSLAHLYAERPPQYGSRTGWAGWSYPRGHVPPTGRASAATGRAGGANSWTGPPTRARKKERERWSSQEKG